MRRASWWMILLLSFNSMAWAATTSVTQQADGFGATPSEAVADALVNASRQALGVALTLNPDFRKQTGEWVAHQTGNSMVITQKWSSAPEARLPTLAGIESYRVLSVAQPNKELWKASVEAKVAKNQSLRPERDKLASVVVMPFTTPKTAYDLHGAVPASTVSQSLRQAMVDSLTQTQQIKVLDRNHEGARAAELLESTQSLVPSERAKLGRNLGADLLLVGSIDTFQLGRPNRQSYGSVNYALDLHARVQYRLIDVATGDVLAARTVSYDPTSAALRADLKAANILVDEEPERLGEVVYPKVAAELTNEVLNTIAPLTVLKVVDANMIYLSGGQGRLQVGDTLAGVSSVTLANAQTGANLAAGTVNASRLEVTQVDDGYAVARQTAGGAITQGANVKKVAPAPQPAIDNHPPTPGSSDKPFSWN